MQPLGQPLRGTSGDGARSGVLALPAPGASGAAPAPSPRPETLSWTPMRASSSAAPRSLSGLKRGRADAAGGGTPLVGSGIGSGDGSGHSAKRQMRVQAGSERLTWRAGRTPWRAVAAAERPPAPLAPPELPEGASKLTTDTARRILMTLEALDQVAPLAGDTAPARHTPCCRLRLIFCMLDPVSLNPVALNLFP
jgi:hypothetical protein